MKKSDLHELHYITHIDNISSIMAHGILCYEQARNLNPKNIAMDEIQEIRDVKIVPGGLPLHKYVNLYIHARNPMLFVLRNQHASLCVLRVNPDVLDYSDTIIADGNASSEYTAFWPPTEGLTRIDRDLVFAEYWTDQDPIEYFKKKRIRCAEALIPQKVNTKSIIGVYVSCEEAKVRVLKEEPNLVISIGPDLFFQN